jgi:hemoglobin
MSSGRTEWITDETGESFHENVKGRKWLNRVCTSGSVAHSPLAAVVDHFSEAVVRNPIVGQTSENPGLREWHTNNLGRLPGLKFMRTLWVCDVAGGPQQYAATKPGSTPLGLEEAHRQLKISPAEFDEVAAELGRTLDFLNVPEREKEEVLAAFAAHKGEVTEGYSQ